MRLAKKSWLQIVGLALSAGALVCLADCSAHAGTMTWTGSTDANWSTPGNWSGGAPPSPAAWDGPLFDSNSTGNLSTNCDIPTNGTGTGWDHIVVGPNTGGDIAIGGNKLNMGGGTENPNGNGYTIDMSAATHDLTINSDMKLTYGTVETWAVAGGRTLTANGAIDGSKGGIIKMGAGTLRLTGINTYTGGTDASGGIVIVSKISDTGDSNIGPTASTATYGNYLGVRNGGTFRYTGSDLVTTTRPLYMDDGVSGAGTFDITDANATLTLSPAGGVRDNNFIKTGAGKLVMNGRIRTTGSVAVNGGTLELTYANDYAGGTDISGGTLSVATISDTDDSNIGHLGSGTYGNYLGVRGTNAVFQYTGTTDAITTRQLWMDDGDGGTFDITDPNVSLTLSPAGGDRSRQFIKTGPGRLVMNGRIRATGSVTVNGGTLELGYANDYSGATNVNAGTLVVRGSIAESSLVSVAAGATLAGPGTVSTISGAGLVSPGNSPGILTAVGVDPSSGLDLAIELTQMGSPVYGSATDSKNDVLHLIGSTPMSGTLTAANAVNVYFGVDSLALGNLFRGGVYVDVATDFLDAVKNASYSYYVLGNGAGTHAFNGVNYYTLGEYSSALSVAVATVADTAAFAGGTVTGGVMQFTVVPEPSMLALLATGLVGLLAYAWKKRKCVPS